MSTRIICLKMVYIPFCSFSSNFLFLIWLYFSSSQYYSPSIPFYAPKQLVGSTRLKPAHDGLPQVQVAILGNPEISNEMNQLGWISESQVLTVTYPCVSFLLLFKAKWIKRPLYFLQSGFQAYIQQIKCHDEWLFEERKNYSYVFASKIEKTKIAIASYNIQDNIELEEAT